jgi:CMP-N-acetylneuraminic acid synthetase
MKAMRIIAVIPAKKSSRRLPGKNSIPLAGLPMFCHSVRVAQAVTAFTDVIVTSDSEEILDIAVHQGARVWRRPHRLCTDEATNFQVLCWLLEQLRNKNIEPELIALLQPTTPFRTPKPIDKAIAKHRADKNADSLATVTRVTRISGRIENARWVSSHADATRMKKHQAEYAITGHLFLLRPKRTLDRGTLLGNNVLPMELPDEWIDIDVDTTNDLMLAQCVAETFFKVTYNE